MGILLCIAVLSIGGCTTNDGTPYTPAPAVAVVMETTMGDITIELYADDAPISVDNFLRYASEGFYEDIIIHRVIQNFVIQGGGHTITMEKREGHDPIVSESNNGLSNEKGTIAVARAADPNSGTSQWFINLKDNPNLDHRDGPPELNGYAVFGRVIDGMDVVTAIAAVPTTKRGAYNDVPMRSIVIQRMRILTRLSSG